MPRQLTKKLYYKKYAFKLELRCDGVKHIKEVGLETTISHCHANSKSDLGVYRRWGQPQPKAIDKVNLRKFCHAVRPFMAKGVKHRIESSTFNLFIEDLATFEEAEKAMKEWLVDSWAPANEQEFEFLTSNNRKVIVDELPYGKFKHRIVFKSNWSKAKSNNFLDWMKKYPEDSYKISPSTLRYLGGRSHYCMDPFMYIEEPKMLTMLQLFAGENIRYAEEFVPRSTLLL